MMGLRGVESGLPPGFRFYPSDEELVCFYLRKKVANEQVASGTLAEVDLHAREPWELPEAAKLTAEEWYFFSFRDRKYATGSRTNRATKAGYWKATGKDRAVHEAATRAAVGMRKTLVFYRGRAPNGHKTGWVMHEFRLETPSSPPKEDWVLCRVFNKTKASEIDGGGQDDLAAAALSQVDLQGQTAAAAAAMAGASSSGSSSAMLDLAMLQYGFLQNFCPGVHGGGGGSAGASRSGCCAGGSYDDDDAMAELELELEQGRHVGLEELGMGMGEIIEMEMEITEQRGGRGSCYVDGLYF